MFDLGLLDPFQLFEARCGGLHNCYSPSPSLLFTAVSFSAACIAGPRKGEFQESHPSGQLKPQPA
jgi:hypothetical protein